MFPRSLQRQLQSQLQLRILTSTSIRRGFASTSRTMAQASMTPVEVTIRTKLTEALSPTLLEIFNDSASHSSHMAMKGSTSTETHFRLNIISTSFQSKMQAARHRMVYALLKEELDKEGGIHALQLRTKTPEEQEKLDSK